MESSTKPIILIVDDTPANIFALQSLLEDSDTLLLTASSGKEALQITLNSLVDLIVLDVQMPEMDGFEVAQILKSSKRTKDIPIIFATAVSKEHRFVMKGYEEGAVDYLYKPLDPQIVKAKVAVLLKMQLQKKELIEKNHELQKSALLINNSADIIGVIDTASLTIEEVNKAVTSILGYAVEEVKGERLTLFLSSESAEQIKNLQNEKKEEFLFEISVYCKDKTVKWLQWKVVAKDGKWFLNARDITQIKEAYDQIRQMNTNLEKRVEEKTRELIKNEMQYRYVLEKRAAELQASNIELERFAFVASHDLQEPLRMITSFLGLLQAETRGVLSDNAKEYVRFAVEGAERLKKLIQALLEYSRLGISSDNMSVVDCNKLVEGVTLILNLQIQETKAIIKIQPLPKVKGIEPQLQQVFQNLLGNALKYHNSITPGIEIGCVEDGNSWRFFVKDNGIGIDPKYHKKIFIIFQRLHDKTQYSGTGIGLAVCKKIVEKHGGKIWVESSAGHGATFYFTLPKVEA